MSEFPSRPPSSFSRYSEPKSPSLSANDLQLEEFSRLSLNSRKSLSYSIRSNLSLYIPPIPNFVDSNSDLFSIRSRQRKNSSEIEWRNSIPGNLVFQKSIAGRSSVYHNDDFHLGQYHLQEDNCMRKELSEKSCPVGNEDSQDMNDFSQVPRAYQQDHVKQDQNGREKGSKKFLKTKNLLRTLGTYLHKYIKYNPRAKDFSRRYFEKMNPQGMDFEGFFSGLLEWVNTLSLNNFQDYQKVWTEPHPFLSLYRQITYKYYVEEAFCDIYHSRLTSKEIYQEYLPQFVAGLLCPRTFTHFHSL